MISCIINLYVNQHDTFSDSSTTIILVLCITKIIQGAIDCKLIKQFFPRIISKLRFLILHLDDIIFVHLIF